VAAEATHSIFGQGIDREGKEYLYPIVNTFKWIGTSGKKILSSYLVSIYSLFCLFCFIDLWAAFSFQGIPSVVFALNRDKMLIAPFRSELVDFNGNKPGSRGVCCVLSSQLSG